MLCGIRGNEYHRANPVFVKIRKSYSGDDSAVSVIMKINIVYKLLLYLFAGNFV